MNVVLCGIIAILETALGCGMLVSCYPERRFANRFARVAEWITFLLICGLYTWNATLCFVSNLAVIAIGLMCGLQVYCFHHCSFSVSLAWMELYFIIMSLLRTPYVIGKGMIQDYNLYHANYGQKPWSGFLYELLLMTFVVMFYFIIWKKHSSYIQKILKKYKILFFFFAVAAWELMSTALFMGADKFPEDTFLFLALGGIGLFLAMACLIIYWMYKNEKSEKKMLLFQQAVLAEKQTEQKKMYEEHERRMHDMKHVLLFLQHSIEDGAYDKALQKLETYQEGMQNKKVWTGNANVDFVLSSKWLRMERDQVDFQLETDFFEIPLDELDFSIILGTLLDNAIEAVQQCETENRKITLVIRAINQMFGMTLWNTSSRKPEMKKGKFQTTKEDKYLHGWGMESVKELVEKYDGEICFRYDEQFFEVKIIFMGGGNKK